MAAGILNKIAKASRERGEALMAQQGLKALKAAARKGPPLRDFPGALAAANPAIIAEIKRASPSLGHINPELDPAALARDYQASGAAALSVLTEPEHFLGSHHDLAAARRATFLPVLCKDFILHPAQLYRARAAGADAALLIAALLSDAELAALHGLAWELGLSPLVEVHTEAELERALCLEPELIGINNRDLDTLTVDLNICRRLLPLVPPGVGVIAESGIGGADDLRSLQAAGFGAFLVGGALVGSSRPGEALAAMLRSRAA